MKLPSFATVFVSTLLTLASASPLNPATSALTTRQQNGKTVCGGASVKDGVPPWADCLAVLDQITVKYRDPTRPIFWYSATTKSHISKAVIPGEAVPRSWTFNRCRVSLGWPAGVPANPVRAAPRTIQELANATGGWCILTSRRTNGVQPVPVYGNGPFQDSGMSVTVNIFPSHEDPNLRDIIVKGLLDRTGPGWLSKFLEETSRYLNYEGASYFP